MVIFTIDGPAVPKQRPRIGVCGRTYTPRKTHDYESKVGWSYLQVYKTKKKKFVEGIPLKVIIEVYESVPNSWSKSKKTQALNREIFPVRKDVDNIAKAILDGLNGVAYDDDGQIVDLHISKQYSTNSYVVVKITDNIA